jgi:hypothetical protein
MKAEKKLDWHDLCQLTISKLNKNLVNCGYNFVFSFDITM